MANIVSRYLSKGADKPKQMEFTDFGGLLLDSNMRFYWTFVLTAGEEVAQLITANQSVYTVSRI
jgi:hypothetical protein